MSQHNIIVQAGSSIRLLTAGKYCDRDIVVTAEGSGGGDVGELDALLDGTLTELNSNASKVRMYACREIDTLVSVNLPEAKEIGNYAFNLCGELTTFRAPKIETLGSNAFTSCAKVEEMLFPVLTSVPGYCFRYCSALKKLDIGLAASVAGYAFGNCTSLETLIVRRTEGVATLNSTSFNSANFAGYIYVPAALVESYKAANYWKNYASRIRAIEDYPDICGT